jgi:hypothetical protein
MISTHTISDEDYYHYQHVFDLAIDFLKDLTNVHSHEDYICLDVYSDETDNIFLSWNGERIELNDEVQKSLNKIYVVFSAKRCTLDAIRIQNNSISFDSANGQYSLIHYINNEIQPSTIKDTATNQIFDLKKIESHWYHKVQRLP